MTNKDIIPETGSQNVANLLEVGTIINSSLELNNVLRSVLKVVNKIIHAEASSILLMDKYKQNLFFNTVTGDKAREIKKFTLHLGEGIAGWVAKTGQPLNVPDVSKDPHFKKDISEKINFPTRNILCVPMKLHDVVIGAVEVINKIGSPYFQDEDETLLTLIANQAATAIENARLHTELGEENKNLRQALDIKTSMIGSSKPMKHIFDVMDKVKDTDSTLLLRGESGTGKELIAKTIHMKGRRSKFPFMCVTCSILNETLLESELFGHEKGSFTGAVARKLGRIEMANRGTLFLDEIGTLSPNTQLRLLRVLQEREFERVGGTETIKVDVRIIAATNENLEKAIQEGRFREDLYYRLKVIDITMPSLRERKEDIPELANFFLDFHRAQVGRPVHSISKTAMEILVKYDWPGNIRELKNVIERAVVLGSGDTILPEHLPSDITPQRRATLTPGPLSNCEKIHIQAVLDERGWNKSESAKVLKISRNRLDRKIKQYALKERR